VPARRVRGGDAQRPRLRASQGMVPTLASDEHHANRVRGSTKTNHLDSPPNWLATGQASSRVLLRARAEDVWHRS
jgi:hypothetical protein